MKTLNNLFKSAAIVATACLLAARTFAQGTAFTYQGQLQNNGALANGTFNLTFALFTNNAGGTAVAGPVTNDNVAISNGLFTVMIDFGPGHGTVRAIGWSSPWKRMGREVSPLWPRANR